MPVLDLSLPAHARADARLNSERVGWLTTVRRDGQPQSSPVWFLWEGTVMLIYSRNKTQKLRNLSSDHLAGFHLAGDGRGGDNVILEGTLQLSPARPSAAANAEYLVKYGDMIEARGWTPESFARDYSSPLDFWPTRARIW